MKNLKTLFSVVCLLAVTALMTSCLDESEDYSISPEQYSTLMRQMAGTYSGKMYFWNDTIKLDDKKKTKEDSLKSVHVYVTGQNDTTVSVTIPAKYLGKNIKETEKTKELKRAIDNAPSQTLKMKYNLYQYYNNTVTFGLYPTEVTTMNLNYGGSDHKVEFSWYNYYNFNGQYSGRYILMSFYLTNIKVDNTSVWTASNSASSGDEYNNPIYTFSLSK